jgi:hypothetical protein
MARSFKQRLAALKILSKKGFYSGDPITGAASSHGRSVLRKFDDFLSGKSKIINLGSATRARSIASASGAIARGKKVIVTAVSFDGMKPKIRVRDNRIFILYRYNGKSFVVRKIKSVKNVFDIEKAKPGEVYIFFSSNGKPITIPGERLETLWNEYDEETRARFAKVIPHLNILEEEHE